MIRFSFLFAIIFITKISFAQIPPGYYNSAQGLTGELLRTELFNIIDGHIERDYTILWGYFQSTDNNASTVWDMYSDIPSGTPVYTYSFGTNQCGNYNSEGDCYNREHSLPKSWFASATPMYSDLFHIYPTDGWVNGKRGNFPYGEVSAPTYTSTNGSKLGANTYPGYSGTVFEPIDEYKGDFARTYFYMMTRYKNNVFSWVSDMFSADNLSVWARNMLLSWDAQDPVDQKEIDRNNAVYTIQGNRNPFIDNPQWGDLVWGSGSSIATVDQMYLNMFVNNGVLQIQNDTQKPTMINVVNILGTTIFQSEIQPGNNQIELLLAEGVYVAWSFVEGKKYTLKFIK